ncbi:5-methylcytosine-specific restriction endonuclease McrA [Aliiruegeria haliotis]|uniref:5-methylcytosine-specific restriction endonuclease McrA n=1 Tax=Aliiruegeria haliotis TaxID=1280846 RepID=A0A2T0RJW1_9RHOB|nr:HNH endonuclease [Aliiruegeria haliotis]PRY21407.1 5-methylcytosine-specific restriction endonuclease McrA [Aliiruegeria haliotis]
MTAGLESHRTLVLNADMRPLSWAPLSVWNWQDALVAVLQERVIQVKAYEGVQVHSAHDAFEIPAVVALKTFRRRKAVSFTRYHLFLRDEFRCQYCGDTFRAKDLTFDHIVPRSRGGGSSWSNIVACCARDNRRKGNKSLREAGMKLLRKPFEPVPEQLDAIARRMPGVKAELHQSWMDFLYWDTQLEQEDLAH